MSLFIPENPLEEALVKAVKHPAMAQDFYRLLLDSDLLVMGTVIVSQGAENGTVTAAPGSQFSLVSAQKDGAHFLPVFSSLVRMQTYAQKECKYVAMKGRALFDLTRGAPLTLNPGSEYGHVFTPHEIAHLLEPNLPRAPLQASYGQAPLHQPLADALSEVFDRRGDIATAWMVQVRTADGTVLVVGVETHAAMASLMPDIQAMARDQLPGVAFDVQKVDPARPLAFSEAMLKAPPFYPRTARAPLN